MNGTQKIKAMLNNSHVDFIGASGWVHTPEVDRKSTEEFAGKIIDLTNKSQWDFIKIMNHGRIIGEAYGEKIKFYTDDLTIEDKKTKHLFDVLECRIQTPDDMATLPALRPDNPVIQRDVKLVRALKEYYRDSLPILPTIFTPCMLVYQLMKKDLKKFQTFAQDYPQEMHHALNSLLETDITVAKEYIKAGADGFFIATKQTCPSMISPEDFQRYCAYYDKQFLSAISKETWFNVLHVCGQTDMYMDEFVKYDVQAINWENLPHGISGAGITSIQQMRELTDKILISGTDQFYDFYGTVDEVHDRFALRLENAVRESKDNSLIFSPGCSLPLDIPLENIHQLRVVVDEYNSRI